MPGKVATTLEPMLVSGRVSDRTVAVDSSDGTLVQYRATLPQGDLDLTVTLAEHGPREVALPSEEETAAVADHPRVAADFGV